MSARVRAALVASFAILANPTTGRADPAGGATPPSRAASDSTADVRRARSPAPGDAPFGANVIFERARSAAAQRCTAGLAYHIIVTAVVGGTVRENRFGATYLGDLDELHVNASSDEEAAHPSVPHGVDVAVTLFGGSVGGLSRALTKSLNHDEPKELIGVPRLRPNYAFGLRRVDDASPPAASDVAGPSSSSSPSSSYRTIGKIASSFLRDYEAALVGDGDLDGVDTYHLRLTPRRDPQRNRLREIWVETASYLPVRIISSANFQAGPATRVSWQIDYRDVDGCRLIDEERALGPLDYGRDRTYERTTLRFEYDAERGSGAVPVFMFEKPAEHDDVFEPEE